ncbi:MAG: hypothetical protein OFPII_30340 [Osedax symbiont Rs1]|nr:MAG: hypothetical protein OFPII_30340 [Osedax symbiont Rs1]
MFGIHGEYQLQQEGDILIIHSKGPFNTKLVDQFSTEMETIIKNLPAAWGQVVFLAEDSMLPPDAEKSLQKACSRRREQGLTASAIIFVSAATTFTMRAQVCRIYDHVGIHYQFFDDSAAAQAWVATKLKF